MEVSCENRKHSRTHMTLFRGEGTKDTQLPKKWPRSHRWKKHKNRFDWLGMATSVRYLVNGDACPLGDNVCNVLVVDLGSCAFAGLSLCLLALFRAGRDGSNLRSELHLLVPQLQEREQMSRYCNNSLSILCDKLLQHSIQEEALLIPCHRSCHKCQDKHHLLSKIAWCFLQVLRMMGPVI